MEKEKKNSTELATNNSNADISKTYNSLDRIKYIEDIVDKFENSSLAEQFKSITYPKGEDGTIDLSGTPTTVFNKADMVLCLALGEELGIPPMQALSYGKSLNLTAVKKVEKGKKLGLDYATALERIYVWGEGSKEIVYTSIEIVTAALSKAGITKEIIQDGKNPIWYCLNLHNGKREIFNPSIHKDINISSFSDADQRDTLEKISQKGIIGVNKDKQPTYVAEVKLTRYERFGNDKRVKEIISIPYSSQEAIDAGLLKGINSDGETIKGKDNWNKHRATHLIKMSLMIGGRLIAPDILNGIYNEAELDFIRETDKDFDIQDAEIIS